MNIEKIMMVVVLIFGIYFWGHFLFAVKEDSEGLKEDFRKNKNGYIIFILLMFSSLLGLHLWREASGEWRDVGIIITVLSGIGFFVWVLKGDKSK